MDIRITGTMIWYYYICKREVWLMIHSLEPDQSYQSLEIGRLIHENSYKRKKKEIDLGNIKIDLVGVEDGNLVLGEVKKSSSFKKSAKMQLAYYLRELKGKGYSAVGYLRFPEERKKEKVELNEELEKELERTKKRIKEIANKKVPPAPKKIKYCSKCAYEEFCWA